MGCVAVDKRGLPGQLPVRFDLLRDRATPSFCRTGQHVRGVPALLDGASRLALPYSLTPPLGEAPALLDLVPCAWFSRRAQGTATPDADDGGFEFFGAIAEMIEGGAVTSRRHGHGNIPPPVSLEHAWPVLKNTTNTHPYIRTPKS